MAGKGYKKRRRLFDLYSRHIRLYDSDQRDIFWCPLCLDGFRPEALGGPEPALTLAHVIPKSLGGRYCTLTCKSCNNDNGGHQIEAPLVERFLAEDCMAGAIRQEGRLSGTFGEIGVQFGRSPEQNAWSVFVLAERSNRDCLDSFKKHLFQAKAEGNTAFSMRLTVPYRHQPRCVEAALYQSAFLLMFAHFGYEFVVHPHFAQLREQIRRPGEGTWRTRIFTPTEESVHSLLGTREHAVMFLRNPTAIVTFLRLHPKGGRQRVLAVVLPGLDDPALPANDWKTFDGGVLPFQPEAVADTRHYMRECWLQTRTARQDVIQGGEQTGTAPHPSVSVGGPGASTTKMPGVA
jgi:hypothetical protein